MFRHPITITRTEVPYLEEASFKLQTDVMKSNGSFPPTLKLNPYSKWIS